MPERALLRERRSNILLSNFNTSRMHLQVSFFFYKIVAAIYTVFSRKIENVTCESVKS
jgi:hypothetical protein